jgi:hypothetical protein
MNASNNLSEYMTARGDGLHPKLRALFDRECAYPFDEVKVRGDGLIQAGPDPRLERSTATTNVLSLSR